MVFDNITTFLITLYACMCKDQIYLICSRYIYTSLHDEIFRNCIKYLYRTKWVIYSLAKRLNFLNTNIQDKLLYNVHCTRYINDSFSFIE